MTNVVGRLWGRFRSLPGWAQALGWLLGWPALAAAFLWQWGRAGVVGKAAAGIVLLFGGLFWFVGPFLDVEPTASQTAASAMPQPAPRPSSPVEMRSEIDDPGWASPAASPATVTTTLPPGVPADAQEGMVERVVDGDTLWVRVDRPGGPLTAGATHKVRLLEIDTPETQHPDKGVECWGPEASAYAASRLPMGSTVYLVADREDTDRYGRFLRYLWTTDGTFFNDAAVRQGYARAVLYEPNDAYIGPLRAAEAEAKAANRGMWGAPCDLDAPPPPAPAPAAPPAALPEAVAPALPPAPAPQPAAGYYENCAAARAAGVAPLLRGDPGYRSALDRDDDGVACE